VVWKLDRLARSLKDLVEIIHDLERRGIGFRSLTESIDTTSTGGRLVFHIFGALAEFEHALIRERTLAGLSAARARGRTGGRKPRLSKADVRKAAAMLADPKITKAEVARHFAVSRVTLNTALAREGLTDRPAAPADTGG
jgi:DNA invertase Pin-like site-specific DNA recombinase